MLVRSCGTGDVQQGGLSVPQALSTLGGSAASADALHVGQAFNVTTKWTGVFPASKEQLEADNAALVAKNNEQDSRLNQQDVTIAALVKQVNSLTPVIATTS